MASTAPGPSLRPLLAACFSASVHGGCVIREVVQQHVSLDLVNKQENVYDPQTIADRRSQQRIIYALRHAFPQLTIVGEEGELASPASQDVVHCDLQVLDAVVDLSDHEAFDWNDLVVWVDPLDGTKRFAAEIYDEVSVLIGITYQMRPIAGVVHLPFHGKCGVTYWGGPGIGVFRSEHDETNAQASHAKYTTLSPVFPHRPLVCTVSSTACDLVNRATHLMAPSRVMTGGATGTMVLGVITGHSDVFFRLKAATRKWDICAVEPLLEALGGKLTDSHGQVYVYDHITNAPDFDNERGLVATLTHECHTNVLTTLATVTLTSALDGRAMTPQWFQECIFPHRQVAAVHVVPNSMHSGPHSVVGKLEIHFADTDDTLVLFRKKSAKKELPGRPAAQWTRDIASYRNEATFYAHFASSMLARGVALIRPFAVFESNASGQCTDNLLTRGPSLVADSENFLLLLECLGVASPRSSVPSNPSLNRYEAADCLELTDTQQALRYLANLHASTYGQEQLIVEARRKLWPSACWWTLSKRGEKELAQALDIWPLMLIKWRLEFESEGEFPLLSELETLGERMVQHAAYISNCLVDCRFETLVHGDFKSANLFFETVTREVLAFDWQWTGVGLGVMDVANLLNTSTSFSLLATDAMELELLHFYYDCLNARRQELGSGSLHDEYPFEAFERHYMLATLEYARVLISNFWKHMTPESCEAMSGYTNCGLGYRTISHVKRMVRKLHQGLERVSTERQGTDLK
ncbi:hypothetical protein CCR75_002489 [Bremia lactucae]|uniref:3'(2'),5'-bisphosphate nucleotidase 1 n=1 Tax=Bremia lactucae TaxID=4779 RepID=A0A976FSQ7_BRELC|nr:hypothetical protein CCR75_002489 [Bremia lactucae]